MAVTQAKIEHWFTYHPPKGTQVDDYGEIRKAGKEFARLIVATLPSESPEVHVAVEKIRESVMWANAGIACDEGVSPYV